MWKGGRGMTTEEKQIYKEVVVTPEEIKAEARKYVLKGNNIYTHIVRDKPSEKIY
jgi:hypothetical protein